MWVDGCSSVRILTAKDKETHAGWTLPVLDRGGNPAANARGSWGNLDLLVRVNSIGRAAAFLDTPQGVITIDSTSCFSADADRCFAGDLVGCWNRTERGLSPGSHSGWRSHSMKCQKCAKPATFHITDIIEKGKHREYHFCDEHARQHLAPPEESLEPPSIGDVAKKLIVNPSVSIREPSAADKQVCPVCQITFLEFRNSGRLGCPYDYEVFRDELMPLLGEHSRRDPPFRQGPQASATKHATADDLDPAPQRTEAFSRRGGLRDGRSPARQDQIHRAGAGSMMPRSAHSLHFRSPLAKVASS